LRSPKLMDLRLDQRRALWYLTAGIEQRREQDATTIDINTIEIQWLEILEYIMSGKDIPNEHELWKFLDKKEPNLVPEEVLTRTWTEVYNQNLDVEVKNGKYRPDDTKQHYITTTKLTDLIMGGNEEEINFYFPYRDSSTQQTQRMRMTTISKAIEYHKGRTILEAYIGMLRGCDYTWTVNSLIWLLLTKDTNFKDYLINDLKLWSIWTKESFIRISKSITSVVKKYPITINNHFNAPEVMSRPEDFLSIDSLVGYIFNDPNFNPFKDAHDLVNDPVLLLGCNEEGKVSHDYFLRKMDIYWEKTKRETTEYVPKPEETSWMEFLQRPDLWGTSGSAGSEKILTDEGQHVRFTKRILAEKYTAEELSEQCMAAKRMEFRAIKKPEQGKVRLAGQGDKESYLIVAYAMANSSHWYEHNNFTSLSESRKRKVLRYIRTVESVRALDYQLPWDFAEFDHQVASDVFQMFNEQNREDSLTSEADMFWRKTGYLRQHAVIIVSEPPKPEIVEPAENGILSGIRTTSTDGLKFNSQTTGATIQEIEDIVGRSEKTLDVSQGDDKILAAKRAIIVVFYRLAFASVGIRGNNVKFAIGQKRTDFLRESIKYNWTVTGILARAIISAGQRKPTSSEPVKIEDRLSATFDVLGIIARRSELREWGLDLMEREFNAIANHSPVPVQVLLRLPKAQGGLGILPCPRQLEGKKLDMTTPTWNVWSRYEMGWYAVKHWEEEVRRVYPGLPPGGWKGKANALADSITDYEERRKQRDLFRYRKWSLTNMDYSAYGTELYAQIRTPDLPVVSLENQFTVDALERTINQKSVNYLTKNEAMGLDYLSVLDVTWKEKKEYYKEILRNNYRIQTITTVTGWRVGMELVRGVSATRAYMPLASSTINSYYTDLVQVTTEMNLKLIAKNLRGTNGLYIIVDLISKYIATKVKSWPLYYQLMSE